MSSPVGNSMTKNLPNPTDKHVGTRVRMRRLMLGMSQSTLADAIGLKFQQVQKYEKGTNRISASRLVQIARALQVPIPFFFDGARSGFAPSNAKAMADDHVTEFLSSSHGVKLVKALMEIKDAAVRRSIVNLVERLADSNDD